MIKHVLTVATTATVLAACATNTPMLKEYKEEFSSNPPTTEWLEENIDSFREKAWEEPNTDNVEVFAYMKKLLDEYQVVEKRQADWQRQTHRLLTVDWLNETRGGAAYRKAAYEHVLDNEQPKLELTSVTSTNHIKRPDTKGRVMRSRDKLAGTTPTGDMAVWQRYCNGGKGMTKSDWQTIIEQGAENIPASLADICKPPK